MYEVPLSLKRDAEPHYDIDPLEATYAVPNEYEYATWGPNKEMVHSRYYHALKLIYCMINLLAKHSMKCGVDSYRS